jgi:Ca-activated chloride channel family protein
MRFGEPQWLGLALAAPMLAALLLWVWRRRERDLRRWCAPPLWARLLPERSRRAGLWRIGLLFLAVLYLALTAARPQLGSRILSVERKGIDLVIALDLSESMLAADLAPDRLTRARQEVQSLIDRLRGDRVALVAFAGEAFVQCPLTLDYAAARMFLRLMNTDLIPVPGTAIADAIRAATRAFDPEERKFKALVLITDGEDHEGDIEGAVREAREQGVRIYAVGIGTARGEPIPLRDASGRVTDYKRDAAGEVVMTRLDPSALERICAETGGRYHDGGAGGLALDRLYAEISGLEQKEQKGGIVTLYEDRYGHFAAVATLLLFAELLLSDRRRGWTFRRSPRATAKRGGTSKARASVSSLLLLCAGLALAGGLSPGLAFAGDPGGKAYRRGDYAAARDAYERFVREHPTDARGTYNLGTALHQADELPPSEEALLRAIASPDPKLRAAAFYNLGNTRVRARDLAGAAEAYEMSLRARPDDKDAKYNLELVRALLAQAPPDSAQQPQSGQDQRDQKEQQQPNEQKQQGSQGRQDKQNPQEEQDPRNPENQQSPEDQERRDRDERQDQDPQPTDPQAGEDRPDSASAMPQPPGEPLKISPEEARRFLEGLSAQEQQLLQERLRARSRKLRVEKDW